MKYRIRKTTAALALSVLASTSPATERFVSLAGNHVPPFLTWADAATNIQAAIDAASDGDAIWVTNGVYKTGGKVMAGDLTNRVALDKAVTVQSVNGWAVTVIEGQRDLISSTGAGAVRVAWLTNGAVLSGFTLRAGQTRTMGDSVSLRNGGGVWSPSTNAVVMHCMIRDNVAAVSGGGAYRGTLINSFLTGNEAMSGGGSAEANLVNCAITANVAASQGGGAHLGRLTNCTVSGNLAGFDGGGTRSANVYNSIIWDNRVSAGQPSTANYGGGILHYSCTTPLPLGPGNTATNPLLLPDGIHLAANSPVRNLGDPALTSGLDLDGQPWANPPSMGCDQWLAAPLVSPPNLASDGWGTIRVTVVGAGQLPLAYAWLKNGEPLTADDRHDGVNTESLRISRLDPEDAGHYTAVVSNAVGVVTSIVAQVTIHCVDAASVSPAPPYSGWSTAAMTIQDAIDAASDGAVVLVTNGNYASGGRVMAGDLMNRVVVDKALLVTSANGPAMTVISGQKDPATNGPTAIRGVWLTQGATLAGFTVRDGATRSSGDPVALRSGGGVWSRTANAAVNHCLILDNAADFGGGVFRAGLTFSTVRGNYAHFDGGGVLSNVVANTWVTRNVARFLGGGARGATIINSALTENTASAGGGAQECVLRNVTITGNRVSGPVSGGGTAASFHTNCIVWNNLGASAVNNYATPRSIRSSCTTPFPGGADNIALDPLLLSDGIHIGAASPARGAGLAVATGRDIDGQPWSNPPSMGCDEWSPEPIAGSPTFHFDTWGRGRITASTAGQSPLTYYWYRQGNEPEGVVNIAATDSPDLPLYPIGPADAGNYHFVVSNAFGVATSAVAQLTIRCVDYNNPSPAPPYTSWATAASTIQDAVDAANAGDLILVTNGIYARGGRSLADATTNRVTVDKALTVMSVNGPSATIIQGQWDVATTNGPGAIRCAALGDGAALIGFTLRGGATSSGGSGGGIWCNSTNALVINCIIRNCSAGPGGGAFRGTLMGSLIHQNFSTGFGGGTADSSLINCTVTDNRSSTSLFPGILAMNFNLIHNSIIWGNGLPHAGGSQGGGGGVFRYSCTQPLPPGVSNVAVNPLLTENGLRLKPGSLVANAGSAALAIGYDIDGQPWANPPSMGCDEWHPELAVGQPVVVAKGDGKIRLRILPAGLAPGGFAWFKNGVTVDNDARISGAQTAELAINDFGPDDVGHYSAVATNSLGVVTSTVVSLRARFVDLVNATPLPPFTNWATAAASLQDAVDEADVGELVIVADGIHASGGRVVTGDLANRIVLTKAVTVSSRFGPANAVIVGQKDFSNTNGNGDAAMRAAWLDNGTRLSGFTIRDGATLTNGVIGTSQSGGGVWGFSPGAGVSGCLIVSNSASQFGGGAYGVSLVECDVSGNQALNGGGVFGGELERCTVSENIAANWAGGVYQATIRSSRVLRNTGVSSGGTYFCVVLNSVIAENQGSGLGFGSFAYNTILWGNSPYDYGSSLTLHHTCAALGFYNPGGTNNLFADPQLLDEYHLAATSPCRGAGGTAFLPDTDFDGDAWLNPPSMGAQEFYESALTGPLAVTIELAQTNVLVNRILTLIGRINGRAARIEWNFGDGPTVTNASYLTRHTWNMPGTYPVTFTAFNDDHPAGVTAQALVQVLPLETPTLSGERIASLNRFRLQFTGQADASYTVQFATNLTPPVVWQIHSTLTSTGGVVTVTDFQANTTERYYRLRVQ